MTATLSRWTASISRALAVRAGLLDAEEGQALVEYALILALIALLAITALQALGTSVAGAIQNVANDFP
jgi:Flp pilus assembly pilin Flp